MQQTHLETRAHAIHLDCIVVLLCTQGKTGLIMNNLISTWKVTSGFFQKRFSLSEESSQVSGWMCFPPRLQGHWRQVPTLPLSFETLALSPTPSFMLLLDEAEKHVWNKEGGGRSKKMETIFLESLQLSGALFHHPSWLLASVFRANVHGGAPCTAENTQSCTRVFSLEHR